MLVRAAVPGRADEIALDRLQCGLAQRAAGATDEDVGGGMRPEIGDESGQGRVTDIDAVDVDHSQHESGAGQQVTHRAGVEPWVQARRGAPDRGVARQHRSPQTRQRSRGGHGADQQAVRLQHAPELHERAGQVVRRVQRSRRDDEVEQPRFERQRRLGGSASAPTRREGGRRIDDREPIRLKLEPFAPIEAERADQERVREAAAHVAQTFEQVVGAPFGEEGCPSARHRTPTAEQARMIVEEGLAGHAPLSRTARLVHKPWMDRDMFLPKLSMPGWVRMPLDFALPPRCPGCGTIVDGDHRFCAACWQTLEWHGPPACRQCAMPLPFDDAERCAVCLAHPPAYDRAAAAVAYGPLARTLALKLKYGRRPGLALTFARFMARHVEAGDDGPLVAAVPLHRWRLWWRGFNQSALMARALAGVSGLPVDVDLLRRTKRTPLLRGMGPRARRDAVRGAFAVRPGASVRGRRILLVDDVFTTGSTAHACAKALKRAGAANVEVHVWARVIRASTPGT